MPSKVAGIGHSLEHYLEKQAAENLHIYVPVRQLNSRRQSLIKEREVSGRICRLTERDQRLSFVPSGELQSQIRIAESKRVHAVSCYGGHFVHVAARNVNGAVPVGNPAPPAHVESPYEPLIGYGGGHLFSIKDGVSALFDLVGEPLKPLDVTAKPGLIAICGQTGAAKSQYAEGLIWNCLEALVRQRFGKENARLGDLLVPPRVPKKVDPIHLLTLEQPVEKVFFFNELPTGEKEPLDPRSYGAYGVFYTPRDLMRDFYDSQADPRNVEMYHGQLTPLQIGLQLDALRQKPTITYVGECRSKDDLKEVLQFAQTGHTVVTTFHAGSLNEGMRRLLHAADAKTPADRFDIGSRIVMLVHLVNEAVVRKDTNKSRLACLPSVWLGKSEAVAALTKVGLASLVPNWESVHGRASLADKLLAGENPPAERAEWADDIRRLANKLDLGGL